MILNINDLIKWPDGVVGYHVSLTDLSRNGQGPEFEPQSGQLFASFHAESSNLYSLDCLDRILLFIILLASA